MEETDSKPVPLKKWVMEQKKKKDLLIRMMLTHRERFLHYPGFRQRLLEDIEKADCLITLISDLKCKNKAQAQLGDPALPLGGNSDEIKQDGKPSLNLGRNKTIQQIYGDLKEEQEILKSTIIDTPIISEGVELSRIHRRKQAVVDSLIALLGDLLRKRRKSNE